MRKKQMLYLMLKILLFFVALSASVYNLYYGYTWVGESFKWSIIALFVFFLFPWELLWRIIKQASFFIKLQSAPNNCIRLMNNIWRKNKDYWREITWIEVDFIERMVRVTIFLTFSLVISYTIFYYRFPETWYWVRSSQHIAPLFISVFSIRQSVRYLFPSALIHLDKDISALLQKKFINRPNTTRLFSYVMMAAVLAAALIFILRPEKQITYGYDNYDEYVISTIKVTELELHPQTKMYVNFEFIEYPHIHFAGYWSNGGYYNDTDYYIDPVGVPPILEEGFIVINGKNSIVTKEGEGIFIPKVTTNLELDLTGNNFYFPFDQYTGIIHIKGNNYEFGNNYLEEINPKATYVLISKFRNQSYEVHLSEDISDWNNIIIYAEYSRYYKLLVSIIGLVLFAFLLLIFRTNQKDQLIELSVGVFATIITLRGFLIPKELDGSPLFLDQVLLFYIVLFLIAILYKYGEKIK